MWSPVPRSSSWSEDQIVHFTLADRGERLEKTLEFIFDAEFQSKSWWWWCRRRSDVLRMYFPHEQMITWDIWVWLIHRLWLQLTLKWFSLLLWKPNRCCSWWSTISNSECFVCYFLTYFISYSVIPEVFCTICIIILGIFLFFFCFFLFLRTCLCWNGESVYHV